MSDNTETKEAPVIQGENPELTPATQSIADKFREAMSSAPESKPEPATPAPVEAAPEPATEPEEKPVSRSAKDFKLIKQERDEAKVRAAELLSQVSDLEQYKSVNDEYQKLKTEYAEISDTLSLTNLERHPKFKEQYNKPLASQIERAKAYVPEADRSQLEKVLRMPVGETRANALDELVGELPASRQAYLQGIVSRIDEISYERDEKLTQAQSSYEEYVASENAVSEQQTTERNQALEKSFSTMLAEAQDNVPMYQLREGDEEWNTGVRERVQLAKKILLEQNSFEDAATAALWAASGGALLEQNAALTEHNRRMNAELEKLKGAEPSSHGGVSPHVAGGNPLAASSKAFSDRVLSELQQRGVR